MKLMVLLLKTFLLLIGLTPKVYQSEEKKLLKMEKPYILLFSKMIKKKLLDFVKC